MHENLQNQRVNGIKGGMPHKERSILFSGSSADKPDPELYTKKTRKPKSDITIEVTRKAVPEVGEEQIWTRGGEFSSRSSGIIRLGSRKMVQGASGEQPLSPLKFDWDPSPRPQDVHTGSKPDLEVDSAPEDPPSPGDQKARLADIDFRTLAKQYAQERPHKEPGAFLRAVLRSHERYKAMSPRNVPPPTPEELTELFAELFGNEHR